ncbi:hypothetical protein KIN20_020885 [Parelaphostrongylus tenuis]|uniref:Uncharacterized protein n=1 Tax=Parelaphostrongylus tenuis TaxID=148309 RepID=A0AAD5MN67_PARTN|nr:hypothetical protein KIN20_020885 [Parelaphostrongylus tenuis]
MGEYLRTSELDAKVHIISAEDLEKRVQELENEIFTIKDNMQRKVNYASMLIAEINANNEIIDVK